MNKIQYIKYTLLLSVIVLLLGGCRASRAVKKAYKTYEIGEYYKAADLFNRAAKRSKKDRDLRTQIMFDQAECYRLIGQNTRANSKYGQVIRYKFPDSIVYLRAAQVAFELGRFSDVKKHLDIFLQYDSAHVQALNMRISLDSVKAWREIKTRYVVKKADDFNIKNASSFSPTFVGEEYDAVLFTSTREGLNPNNTNLVTGQKPADIFETRLDSKDKWLEPKPLDQENINTEFDDGTPFVTSDGKSMFFTRCRFEDEKNLGAQIFKSDKSGAKWSEPKMITLLEDSTADSIVFAHPTTLDDESMIVFVSDMSGGFGGKDLWMVRTVGDKKGVPENLGASINTPGDEWFPFLRDENTIYFSSDGHPGFGGLDIYKASYDAANESWSVENMLTPINSGGDDFGITFAGENEYGFFSSNRNDKRGFDNIYSFVEPVPTFLFQGTIKDAKTDDALTDAYIRLIGNDGTNVKIRTKKDGSYSRELDLETEYVFLVAGRGYLNQKGEVETLGLKESKNFTNDFALSSIKKPIRLDNIVYEFNKWTLTEIAKMNLEGLIAILEDNPKITIEISAHTDYVGTSEANRVLSEKRAMSVVEFLVAEGIEEERLTAVGYGEIQPTLVDELMARKSKAFKAGTLLTEEFILKQSKDKQERANQLNRRTEFKVLSTNYKPRVKVDWRKKYSK